jgi:hypothetical protein
MDPVDKFLKYDYGETKDLLKTFITLISGTLVLSLTFSEKVIGFSQAPPSTRRTLFAAWALFIFALISAGLSLCLIAAAAGKLLYGAIPFFDHPYWMFSLGSTILILVAGASYVVGLIVLAVAAAMAIGYPAKVVAAPGAGGMEEAKDSQDDKIADES